MEYISNPKSQSGKQHNYVVWLEHQKKRLLSRIRQDQQKLAEIREKLEVNKNFTPIEKDD